MFVLWESLSVCVCVRVRALSLDAEPWCIDTAIYKCPQIYINKTQI